MENKMAGKVERKEITRVFRTDIFWNNVLTDPRLEGVSVRPSKRYQDFEDKGETVSFVSEDKASHVWITASGWRGANRVDEKFTNHETYATLSSALRERICPNDVEWDKIIKVALDKLEEQQALPPLTTRWDLLCDNVVTNPFILRTDNPSLLSSEELANIVASDIVDYVDMQPDEVVSVVDSYKPSIDILFGSVDYEDPLDIILPLIGDDALKEKIVDIQSEYNSCNQTHSPDM